MVELLYNEYVIGVNNKTLFNAKTRDVTCCCLKSIKLNIILLISWMDFPPF